jgi:hypothetical protein
VVFDDPLQSLRRIIDSGITVPKVQVSAALRADCGFDTAEELARFAEGTYLHQVRIKAEDGSISSYPDLNADALQAVADGGRGEVRVHMHVPLYFSECGPLRSTVHQLDAEFFAAAEVAGISQFEIETYTFGVLPPELAKLPIVESISQEFDFLSARLATDENA